MELEVLCTLAECVNTVMKYNVSIHMNGNRKYAKTINKWSNTKKLINQLIDKNISL